MKLQDRRLFLAGMLAFASTPTLLADDHPHGGSEGIFPLPPPFNNQTATLVEITCPPGQRSTAHKHPGFVLGYVIEGDLRFQIAGEPERIVKQGGSFWEPPGAVHLIAESANQNRSVRFLAIVIAESGKALLETL